MPADRETVKRTNRWCFTINNYGEYFPVFDEATMEYMIFQEEIAPTTGTHHLQGYVRFKTAKQMLAAKKAIAGASGLSPEMTPAKGTEEQNRTYCTKDESKSRKPGTQPHEFGVYSPDSGKQGKRTDLENIAQQVIGGMAIRDVARENPVDFIRYHQGIHALAQLVTPLPPVQRQVKVICMWGPTGTGKTHRVRMAFPEVFEVTPGRDPWGTYNGEKTILFDEFDYSKWTIQEMNRYLDKWRCNLSARYHDRFGGWTLVVICANSRPESWWPAEGNSLLKSAFLRRITTTVWVENQEMEIPLIPPADGEKDTTPSVDIPPPPSTPNPTSSSGSVDAARINAELIAQVPPAVIMVGPDN